VGKNAVLLDLDGTLTDPYVGITGSLQYVLEKMGRIVPPAEDLKWCIGPPIQSNVGILLGTEDPAQIQEGVRLYRERYSAIGKFENTLIDGIPEVLAQLVDAGMFLSLATSKLKTYAMEIVEHFDLRRHLHVVHGSELDGSNSDKGELVAHILKTEDIEAANAVMIGDRRFDIAGAEANAVVSIGVLWGYGDRNELEEAGADHIATAPADLPGLIEAGFRLGRASRGLDTFI